MIRRYIAAALIHFEILRSGTNTRIHIARWCLLFITALTLSLCWVGGWGGEGDFVSGIPYVYAVGVWGQLLLLIVASICIITMSFSEERDLLTLPVLLSTPLTSFGICFAKWFAVVIRATLILLVMMPFVSLLFAEGGLATEQIFATLFLTVCMVGVFTAVGVFSAVLYRSTGAGIIQSLCLVVLSAIAYGFLLEFFPAYLEEYGNITILSTLLTEDCLNHIASWRAFAFVSVGAPSVMGPILYTILLVQGALHAVATLMLLWVSSLLLRFVEQSGAQSVWAGLRRKKASPQGNGAGRGTWEQGACRPWLASPYVWRSLSPRASFQHRHLRGTVHAGVFLSLLFLPYLFAVGVSVVTYSACALQTLVTHGVWPRLPRDFPWAFGSWAYYDPIQNCVAYKDVYQSLHVHVTARSLFEIGQGWMVLVGMILLVLCLLVIPIQMALALPRERGNKRLTLLLSTSMTDQAMFAGFWYETLARWRGVLAAMAVAMLVGACIHKDFHALHVVLFVFLFLWSTYFWGTVAMYFGLTSSTPRWAMLKYGGTIFGAWVAVPGILSIAAVLLDALSNLNLGHDTMNVVMAMLWMPNPLAQILPYMVFPEKAMYSSSDSLWTWFIFGMVYGFLFLGIGVALQRKLKRGFRHLLFRHV